MRHLPYVLTALLAISACSGVDYQQEKTKRPGKFSGEVMVFWLAEGDQTRGDGKFIFVPLRNHPLTLDWTDGAGKQRHTTPGIMYTDGGSIPRIVQAFPGFSPWGFAPAYMVHDWVFGAHQCVTDSKATAKQTSDAAIEFDDTVRIMAQAIAALANSKHIAENSAAPSAVTLGVGTPLSRRLWTAPDRCQNSAEFDRISQKYDRLANGEPGQEAAILPRAGGQLVGIISFGN